MALRTMFFLVFYFFYMYIRRELRLLNSNGVKETYSTIVRTIVCNHAKLKGNSMIFVTKLGGRYKDKRIIC